MCFQAALGLVCWLIGSLKRRLAVLRTARHVANKKQHVLRVLFLRFQAAYFFLACFSESIATAITIIAPFMMYCQ